MLQTLALLILAAAVVQCAIIFLVWRHRNAAIFFAPPERKTKCIVEILRARHKLTIILQFANLLLQKNFGMLNFSQQEFIHQTLKEATEVKASLDGLLAEGSPLSLDSLGKGQQRTAEEANEPKPHSILSHISMETPDALQTKSSA